MPCSTWRIARSWRRLCANISELMPWATSRSRLTLPSGLRSAANCGSVLNTRCSRSSLTPMCMCSDAASSTRSRTMLSSVSRRTAGAVEQLHVHGRHLLAEALDAALVRGVPFNLGDAAAVDLGHLAVRCVGEAGVALHAEEDEGRKDQQHQDALEQPGVRADEIEHGGPWTRGNRGSNRGRHAAQAKKANRGGSPSIDLPRPRSDGRHAGVRREPRF